MHRNTNRICRDSNGTARDLLSELRAAETPERIMDAAEPCMTDAGTPQYQIMKQGRRGFLRLTEGGWCITPIFGSVAQVTGAETAREAIAQW